VSLGEVTMNSASEMQKDWFEWADTFLANWKAGDAEWHATFSPNVVQVLKLATQAALSLNHDAVGAEHLLAGMLKSDSGEAAAALRRAGLTLPALRQEIEAAWDVIGQNEVKRPIPYTPRCRGIIERAQARIRGLVGVRVKVEDLLLELLAEHDGLPAQMFQRRAIDVEAIKRAITAKTQNQ